MYICILKLILPRVIMYACVCEYVECIRMSVYVDCVCV